MQNALLMESIKIIGSYLNKFDDKLVREVKERLPEKISAAIGYLQFRNREYY